MEDLEGSSRIMRFTIIFSSRSVNQPFSPRNQLDVVVGDEGMSTNAKRPTTSVMSPCNLLSKLGQDERTAGFYFDQE